MTEHPLIRLNPGQERRLKSGHPWAYSNEIRMQPEFRQMPAGAPVRLEGDDGWRFGTFAFNPHSLIARAAAGPRPGGRDRRRLGAPAHRRRGGAAGAHHATGRSTGWCMPRRIGCRGW